MSIKGTWVFRSKMADYGSSFNVNVDVTFHTYSGESVSSWDGTYMDNANSGGIIAFRNGSNHQGVVFRYLDIYSYEDSWSSLKIYSYSEAPALLTTVTFNTDTFDVISGSITAESFLTWLQANATKIEDTPTITRVLKKLFLGDVVAKGTTRQLRKLTTEEPVNVVAGLFDADDNIIASWETLTTTYGMNCEKYYTSSTYKTDTASPYYVLTNYTDLANGTKLVIDDSVTRIGEYAFRDCNSLTSITIPDSVTGIDNCAFYNCTSLTSVVIGDSVTRIGKYAFGDCNSLTSINYGGTITQWSAINLDDKWNSNVPATYVQCTDGTVTL